MRRVATLDRSNAQTMSPLCAGKNLSRSAGRTVRPNQISASRSFESPKLSSRTPTLSISDRYRLHIFRFGLPR